MKIFLIMVNILQEAEAKVFLYKIKVFTKIKNVNIKN